MHNNFLQTDVKPQAACPDTNEICALSLLSFESRVAKDHNIKYNEDKNIKDLKYYKTR